MGWKIAKGLMGTLFLAAAAVQWNDPDPLIWMAIYAAAAFACLKIGASIRAAVAAISVAWAIFLLSKIDKPVPWGDLFSMQPMTGDSLELAREAMGLALIAVWMLVMLFGRKPGQPPI